MDFKTDLASFVELINSNSSQAQIRKTYLDLVKKYHPDTADESSKAACNEYMISLNSVYAGSCAKTKAVKTEDINISIDPKKQSVYFRKIFEAAKSEMEKGYNLLYTGVNHLDRKAVSDNSFEIMMHYMNAIKLYRFIIKNSSDQVLKYSAEFDLQMLIDYNNHLSKSLLQDSGFLMPLD